jgi:cobalt-zinc-cadmium efflux system protein
MTLTMAFCITIAMAVIETVGGILSNSLALLGDAGHMFMDSFALGLSLFAFEVAQKPATPSRTYGYRRAEILAALVNGIVLILVAIYIFYEAYSRFIKMPEIRGSLMLIVALVGFFVNLIVLSLLKKVGHDNLNIKGAFLHVLGDTMSSIGVIIAALAISFTGVKLVDPLMSLIIGGIILRGAIGLVTESGRVLLEATPKGINVIDIINETKKIEGVRDLHDLHVWTITSDLHAMSGHLLIEDQMVSKASEILAKVSEILRKKFGIAHVTIQVECEKCEDPFICKLEA